jgi:hypothetical protein
MWWLERHRAGSMVVADKTGAHAQDDPLPDWPVDARAKNQIRPAWGLHPSQA